LPSYQEIKDHILYKVLNTANKKLAVKQQASSKNFQEDLDKVLKNASKIVYKI